MAWPQTGAKLRQCNTTPFNLVSLVYISGCCACIAVLQTTHLLGSSNPNKVPLAQQSCQRQVQQRLFVGLCICFVLRCCHILDLYVRVGLA